MTDFCNPMDYRLPASSVHGIIWARILEWVAIPFSRGPFRPRDQSRVSCIAGSFFTAEPPGKPMIVLKWNLKYDTNELPYEQETDYKT